MTKQDRYGSMESNSKQVYWGAIISYISTFVSLGISLLLTPLIIRFLGQSDYGLYESIGSFVNYLAVLDLGFSAVITRYVAKYQIAGDYETRNKFMYTCRNVYAILCTIILIIGAILYTFIDDAFGESFTQTELDRAHVLFLIVLGTTVFSIFSQIYKGALDGMEIFVWPRILNLLKNILSKITCVMILFYGSNSIGYVLVMFVFEILACILLGLKTHTVTKFTKNHMPLVQLKEIFLFSSYLFIMAIIAQIYWQIDKLILGMCAGTIVVAIYSAALNIENIVRNVSSSIKDLLIPRISRVDINAADASVLITNFMIKSGRVIFIVYGLLLTNLTVLGFDFLNLWLGEEYGSAQTVLLILAYGTFAPTVLLPGEEICKAYNLHGPLSIIYLCTSVLNIILTVVLVKIFGMIGAAISTAIGLVVGNVIISLFYFKKKLHIDILTLVEGILKKLFIVFTLTTFCGYLINLKISANSWLLFVINGLIISLIYIFLLIVWGLNNDEKKLFNKLLIKLKKR